MLQQNTCEIQPGCYPIRSEAKSGFEMTYRTRKFPLLRQDQTQGGVGLGISGKASDRVLEVRAGGGKVAFSEGL